MLTDPEFSGRVRFVLVEPAQPGNVGAAARAIRAMGFRELVLVRPRTRDVAAHPEAIAFASGADDVLAGCREAESLAEAIADVTLAVALSASSREFGPEPAAPALAVTRVLDELVADPSHRVAFVFGCERTGLAIDDVLRCQALACIPTDPSFRSLNLAQAVQIVAWEVRRALIGRDAGGAAEAAGVAPAGGTRDARSGDLAAEAPEAGQGGAGDDDLPPSPAARRARRARPSGAHATQREVEALFAHLERALVDVRFLDPAHPKKLMPRLRRLFSRTRLEVEEVELLRGICTQMSAKGRS